MGNIQLKTLFLFNVPGAAPLPYIAAAAAAAALGSPPYGAPGTPAAAAPTQIKKRVQLAGDQKNLVVSYVNITTHGLHSFRYASETMWKGLAEDLRPITFFNDFESKVRQTSFRQKCSCNS